jgi:hypothetical protein
VVALFRAFEIIQTNVGMSLSWIFILLVFVGGIIFYADRWERGLLCHFAGFGLLTIWFVTNKTIYNYAPALIIFMLFGVILGTSIFFMRPQPGGIQ